VLEVFRFAWFAVRTFFGVIAFVLALEAALWAFVKIHSTLMSNADTDTALKRVMTYNAPAIGRPDREAAAAASLGHGTDCRASRRDWADIELWGPLPLGTSAEGWRYWKRSEAGSSRMNQSDPDAPMRTAAFEHVRGLGEVHEHLTASHLRSGFAFAGERVPLFNPQRGIFKPQRMRFLLSIRPALQRQDCPQQVDPRRYHQR